MRFMDFQISGKRSHRNSNAAPSGPLAATTLAIFLAIASSAIVIAWPNPANSTDEMAAGEADAEAALGGAVLASVNRGRKIFQDTGGCADCHGWDGKSGVEGQDAPALYQSALTAEQILEVIQGGHFPPASPRQIGDVATYVVQAYKLREMTLEECENIFAAGDASCDTFR
jgi:mono/diheme cytochrome c family protein